MTARATDNSNPLVTVLLSTYNRPMYLRQALKSILAQTYRNLQIILVRDGGEPVRSVVEPYLTDPRLTFIDRHENWGLPRSFNQALGQARGKYICYLGDDDLFYPHHVQTLVEALEGQYEYEAAYTDLYKVHCRIEPDGKRTVLAKNIEISRDYDRTSLLQFSHILHVSLMHTRKILERTGPYNENVHVLIDYDLIRRMAFFTDFKHIPKVTGEFYAAIEKDQDKCSRISNRKRKDRTGYILNLLRIYSSRPPKPWTKMQDTSLVLLADTVDDTLLIALEQIWSHTFFPFQIYLPLPESQLRQLKTIVPNILGVPVSPGANMEERLDTVLACCDGDYIGIVPYTWRIRYNEVAWIEKSLYALMHCEDPNQAFELVGSRSERWAAVFRRQQLATARRLHKSLPLLDSIREAGILVRPPRQDEWPFQFENMTTSGQMLEKQGMWSEAARLFEMTQRQYGNDLWMMTRRADDLYHAGRLRQAAQLARQVNSIRSSPATLLIEARARRKVEGNLEAIGLLRQAEMILEGSELTHAG
ncbi:MAG: glycosyltransferase [Sedimentisphaerales bacterium]|nr:glycosyltransferase [Sedimentisphaerales bacterium]